MRFRRRRYELRLPSSDEDVQSHPAKLLGLHFKRESYTKTPLPRQDGVMISKEYHPGQRLSLKGQTCTIRYVGPVEGKSGDWLGVEWDDPERGKHNGTHEGRKYFQCKQGQDHKPFMSCCNTSPDQRPSGRSTSPAAASFLRPNQQWDLPQSFLRALTKKYMSASTHDTTRAEHVYFSGKQAEEIGFSKFSERQSQLKGIHVLVLDRMAIRRRFGDETEDAEIREVCKEITDLDLSRNSFESFEEVVQLASLFPKLRSLALDGNRFDACDHSGGSTLPTVRILSLSRTLLSNAELANVLCVCPSLESLDFTSNELSSYTHPILSRHLKTLDLSSNALTSLSSLHRLSSQTPALHTLNLKRNTISTISPTAASFPPTLSTINLSNNALTTFTPLTNISLHPTLSLSLRHLTIANNPLFTSGYLTSTTTSQPLTAADGYNLTLARLPRLQGLNHSAVTEKERLNAEAFYLGQISGELAAVPEGDEQGEKEVLDRHPRWDELCLEYGKPDIASKRLQTEGKGTLDPGSLGARFVELHVKRAPGDAVYAAAGAEAKSWRMKVPKAMDVYGVLGLVGRSMGVSPLELRLFVETGEVEVGARDCAYAGPEWWDSDDEGDESVVEIKGEMDVDELKREQVELVPGTRALGTYVEGRSAVVEVRVKD